MKTTNLTREELNMLGFNEQGVSTIGSASRTATMWESAPRPRTTQKRAVQQSLHFNLDSYSKPVSEDKQTQLASMVGKFVCVKGVYGMIDAVHNDRLGFVVGSEDEWSCHIVPMNQARVCTQMEEAIARGSAEWYYLNECQSLHHRLAICGERERDKLREMYNECMMWYGKVKDVH